MPWRGLREGVTLKHPGSENLIPLNKRSKEEQRKIQSMGGKASGRVRRKKANLKRTLETLLALDLPDSELKLQLEAMGIDPSLEQGLAFSVLYRTIQEGNMHSLKVLSDLLEQTPTALDRKEQRARTKRLEVEAQRIEEEIERKSGRAGSEESEEQIAAIADMINTPRSERVLEDYMAPIDDEESEEGET